MYFIIFKLPLEKLLFSKFEVSLLKMGTPDFNNKAPTRLQIFNIRTPQPRMQKYAGISVTRANKFYLNF
jgi:hypothetical protein